MRPSGRERGEIRPIRFSPGISHPLQHSVMVEMGNTVVLCGFSITDGVPPFLKGTKQGWLTCEYDMLPLSSGDRIARPRQKTNGRIVEIQRLIGRVLRSMVDLSVVGEKTFLVDCDVLSADGGTRTAAITGASVALQAMLQKKASSHLFSVNPLRSSVAAISVGIVKGEVVVDLDYAEDVQADADMNLVMNARGEWIEVQGSSEKNPFSQQQLDMLLNMGREAIHHVMGVQDQYLRSLCQTGQ